MNKSGRYQFRLCLSILEFRKERSFLICCIGVLVNFLELNYLRVVTFTTGGGVQNPWGIIKFWLPCKIFGLGTFYGEDHKINFKEGIKIGILI